MTQQNNGFYPNMNGAQYAGQQIFGQQGYGMNQNNAPVKLTTTLTAEQANMLKDKGDAFSLQLTEEDRLRGICVHRDPNTGTSALYDNPDGTTTCSICHHVFCFGEYNDEDVSNATEMILNILQTVKLLYLDMPDKAAADYYQIIPLIAKIPKLFKIAAENFRRHENIPGFVPGQSMSPFAIFGALSNPGVGGFGYNAPQMGGFQQQAPQFMGNPMMGGFQQQAPQFAGGQVAPTFNPANAFGFPGAGDPNTMNYNQAPQMQQPTGYQPQTGQQAPQQAAPQQAPADVTKEAQVNAKFTQ